MIRANILKILINRMTLNPPETAPKDDFILGVFNQEKRMYPVVWNHDEGTWQFVVRSSYPYCTVASYLEWTDKLTGWLPLPKIDEEGNVT